MTYSPRMTITLVVTIPITPELSGIEAEKELRDHIAWRLDELDDPAYTPTRDETWQRVRNFWADLQDATITIRKD